MEPQDAIHYTPVSYYFVFQGFLHKAVDVVDLKSSALVKSLQGWFVEEVHFIN